MKKISNDGYWAVSVFAAVALSSLLAVAGEGPRPEPAPAGGAAPQAPSVLTVSLEKFKQQCADPSKSEIQRAPQDIKLVCRNHEVTWLAAAPGEIPLKSVRTVSTTVISDKFRVAEVSKNVDVIQAAGSCQRFQEVIEQYAVEVPVTCEQVLHDKVEAEDLCQNAIDESKDKNESAVQVAATGRVIDTCAQLSIIQK
jgi:hypothetical protein